MKVLIIDDEPDVRSVARLSLGRVGGMEVIELPGGVKAVETATRECPAVARLDVIVKPFDPMTLASDLSRILSR